MCKIEVCTLSVKSIKRYVKYSNIFVMPIDKKRQHWYPHCSFYFYIRIALQKRMLKIMMTSKNSGAKRNRYIWRLPIYILKISSSKHINRKNNSHAVKNEHYIYFVRLTCPDCRKFISDKLWVYDKFHWKWFLKDSN